MGVWGDGGRNYTPVVVWVVGIVAALNPLKPVAQLLLIQLEIPDHACRGEIPAWTDWLPNRLQQTQRCQTASWTQHPAEHAFMVGLHVCCRMLLSKQARAGVVATIQASTIVCVRKHTLLAAGERKSVDEGVSN